MNKLLEAKNLNRELINEYIETMDNKEQEQLWNILNSEDLKPEQKKQLFSESIYTSRYYKLSQIVK